MAKLWYEPKDGGNQLHVWEDPQILIKTDMQSQLAAFQEISGLGDDLKMFLAQGGIPGLGIGGGYPDLESFDDYLSDEIDRFLDLLDYFDYSSRVENLTVRDGEWYSPEVLESVSHEESGSEGIQAIDGDNQTYWQSNQAGVRSIVFRLRGYRKTVEKIRLRTPSTDLRSQIQDVTIRMAGGLGNIDNPDKVVATGVDFTYVDSNWKEFVLPTKKRTRYIKLEMSGALQSSNPDHVRIREIGFWVGITNHDK